MTNAPTPETIRCLEEGKIDFGVVTTPFSGHGAIHSTEVKPIDNVFIAGSSFKELQGKELDYSILCDLPCIFLEKNTSTRLFMDQFLSQKGIELKPEFELATSDMIVQFARRNMGVGCVMEGFAEEAIERGEVFALSFKEKIAVPFHLSGNRRVGVNVHGGKAPVGTAYREIRKIDSGYR